MGSGARDVELVQDRYQLLAEAAKGVLRCPQPEQGRDRSRLLPRRETLRPASRRARRPKRRRGRPPHSRPRLRTTTIRSRRKSPSAPLSPVKGSSELDESFPRRRGASLSPVLAISRCHRADGACQRPLRRAEATRSETSTGSTRTRRRCGDASQLSRRRRRDRCGRVRDESRTGDLRVRARRVPLQVAAT